MSRSYKIPIYKLKNRKGMKEYFNRCNRNKELYNYGYYKKVNCPYDICDFKYTVDKKELESIELTEQHKIFSK